MKNLNFWVLAATLTLMGCDALMTKSVTPATPPKPVTNKSGVVSERLNAGVQKPITYQTRESRVAVMTTAFSVSNNAKLKRASESFNALARAMQNLVPTAAAGLTSNPVSFTQALRNFQILSARRAFRLARVSEIKQGDVSLLYDDATKELTGIKSAEAELRFSFKNQGNQRIWKLDIVKSPDRTRGAITIDITSTTWKSYEWPNFSSPPITCTLPEPQLTPSPGGLVPVPGLENEQADDDWSSAPVCGFDPDWVAPSPVPFRIAGNEYPEFVEKASLQFDIVPKGDESLKFRLSGDFDEPQNVPDSSIRVPTHWVLNANFPGIDMDWDSRLKLIPRNSSFEGKGRMLVQLDEGEEAFNYALGFNESQKTGTFALTNVGARIQLLMTGNGNAVHTRLLSTEDGSEMGTVTMVRNNTALVKFKDGSTKEWELFPAELLGTAVAPVPQPLPAPAIAQPSLAEAPVKPPVNVTTSPE